MRLYERGVDLSHIGAYVRRWQRWARSGLRAMGEELAERAVGLVGRSLGLVERLDWAPATRRPAVAGPTEEGAAGPGKAVFGSSGG
jgi:hypothetical protein